jgi:hypothetical protein
MQERLFMNIDRNKKVFVLDFDNHLYDLLKDSYNIVRHSNCMQDFIETTNNYDYLITDIIYQDGDLTELVKHVKQKPICLEKPTTKIYELLKNKVDFVSIDEFLTKEEYIDISSDLEGYRLTLKLLREVILNEDLIGDLNGLYQKIGEPRTIEKNIRYYKERLFDLEVLESEFLRFNKSYPTNTEFFRLLLELYNAKKIKVD